MKECRPKGPKREDDYPDVKINGVLRASSSSCDADGSEYSSKNGSIPLLHTHNAFDKMCHPQTSGSVKNHDADSSLSNGTIDQTHHGDSTGENQSTRARQASGTEGLRQDTHGKPPVPKAPNSSPVQLKRGRFLVKTAAPDNNSMASVPQNGINREVSASSCTATIQASAGEDAFMGDPLDASGRQAETQSLPGLSSSDPTTADVQPKVSIRRGRFSVLEASTGPEVSSVSTPIISNNAGASAYITIKNEEANDERRIPVYSNEVSMKHVPAPSEDTQIGLGENDSQMLRTQLNDGSDRNYVPSMQESSKEEVAQLSDSSVSKATAGAPLRQKKGRFIVENVIPLTSISTTQSASAFHSSVGEAIPVQVPLYDDSDAASAMTSSTLAHEQVPHYLGNIPPSTAIVVPAVGPSPTTTNAVTTGGIGNDSHFQQTVPVGVTREPLVATLPVPETTSTTLSFAPAPVVFALEDGTSAAETGNTSSEALNMHVSAESESPAVPRQPTNVTTTRDTGGTTGQMSDASAPGVTKKGRFVVLRASNGASSIPEPMGIVSSTLGLTPVTLTTTSHPTADGSTATMGVLTTSTPVSVMSLPSNPVHQVVETSSPPSAAPINVNTFSGSTASSSWPSSTPQTNVHPGIWQGNTIVVHASAPPEDMAHPHSKQNGAVPIPPSVGAHPRTRLSRAQGAPKEKLSRAARAHSAPVERGLKDAVFDMKSVDVRRSNGIGRISHYLEEMKEEIQDFDNMNRSLQAHVKIFRDKNKELEAKNRTLERKYLDEKRCREQAEQKIKQLRRKISSMQKELAASEARGGQTLKQIDCGLPNVEASSRDSPFDTSRVPQNQSTEIEEKCSFSDGEIKETKDSMSPIRHRKTVSMANPTASLNLALDANRLLVRPEEEVTQPIHEEKASSSNLDDDNRTSSTESLLTQAQVPVDFLLKVDNEDEKTCNNMVICAPPCVAAPPCVDREYSEANTQQTTNVMLQTDLKEEQVAKSNNQCTSNTTLTDRKNFETKPPHDQKSPQQSTDSLSNANGNKQGSVSNLSTSTYSSQIENQRGISGINTEPDVNAALFIAPSSLSLGPTFYQQLGVVNAANGIGTLNSRPLNGEHRRSKTGGSMTLIATESPTNDFRLNQGFVLTPGAPLIQASQARPTEGPPRAAVSDFGPPTGPTCSSTLNALNQAPAACHVSSQSLYIAHDHALQHSAMVKHISDPGGLYLVDANNVQQMQLLAPSGIKPSAKSTPSMGNYGTAYEGDLQTEPVMGVPLNSVEDPFAELVERRSNHSAENQF